MKKFARLIIGTATISIQFSTTSIQLGKRAWNYKLKNIHYFILPFFYGLPNEDSFSIIRYLYSTVQIFSLSILDMDQLRMRYFSYTLKDKAKACLMSLPLGFLITWEDFYNKFIGNFCSNKTNYDLRVKISTFSQMEGESFHKA